MYDDLSININDLATWIAVLISVVALYYSRKAFRFQVRIKRREQVALINISTIKDGVEVTNPQGSPLISAQVLYHHGWFGTYHGYIDPEVFSQRFSLTFPVIEELRELQRDKWKKYARWRQSETFIGRHTPFKRRPERPRRLRPQKKGRKEEAIAEMILTDATREEWYMNTCGAKRHVPRRILRRPFLVAVNLRLIGYPLWSNFNFLHLNIFVFGMVDTALMLDHYFNGSQFLVTVLVALGWQRT